MWRIVEEMDTAGIKVNKARRARLQVCACPCIRLHMRLSRSRSRSRSRSTHTHTRTGTRTRTRTQMHTHAHGMHHVYEYGYYLPLFDYMCQHRMRCFNACHLISAPPGRCTRPSFPVTHLPEGRVLHPPEGRDRGHAGGGCAQDDDRATQIIRAVRRARQATVTTGMQHACAKLDVAASCQTGLHIARVGENARKPTVVIARSASASASLA